MNRTIQLPEQAQRQLNQQGCIANNYHIIKMLFKGDYLAKDANDDRYLLSNTLQRRRQFQQDGLNDSHIIEPIEIIQDHSHFYEVFPLQRKMIWAGDLMIKNKSQIYCVSLLYNAIRNIIRPLINSIFIKNVEKYIIIENVFVRETSLFLFLRNKEIDKHIYKTQLASQKKKFNFLNQQGQNKIETSIIKKVGEVFWKIFFRNEKEASSQSKPIFRNILVSMIQEKINVEQLQRVMQDRSAKKKFMQNKREITGKYYTKNRYGTIDVNELTHNRNKQSIQSVYGKLQDITISFEKPSRGFFFKNNRRSKDQFFQRNNQLLGFDNNLIPPSFAKSKRYKKLSLFGDAKTISTDSRSHKKYSLQYKTPNKSNRYSININPTENISFSTQNKKIQPVKNNLYQRNRIKSRNIKAIFNEIITHQDVSISNIDKFNKRSQQKAIILLKKSIQQTSSTENSQINDQKFRNALKQKRLQFKRNINACFSKMHQYNSKGKQYQMKSTIRSQINNQQSINKIANNLHDFVSQNTQKEQKNIVSNQLFISQGKLPIQVDNKQQSLNYLSKKVKQQGLNRFQREQQQNPIVQKNILLKNDIIQKDNKLQNDSKANNLIKNPQKVIKNSLQANFNERNMQQNFLQAEQSKLVEQKIKQTIKQRSKRQLQQIQSKPITRYESQIQLYPINMDKMTSKINNKNQIIVQKQTKDDDKADKMNKYYNKVEQNVFNSVKEVQYTVFEKKKQEAKPNSSTNIENGDKKTNKESQIIHKKPHKPQKSIKSIRNIPIQQDDQIQEVNIGIKKQLQQKKNSSVGQISKQEFKSNSTINNNQQLSKTLQAKPQKKQQIKQMKSEQIARKTEQKLNMTVQTAKKQQNKGQNKGERIKTTQSNISNASSTGIKSIKKQIDQYIFMINRIGEAVAKTSKLSKKLQKVQWYTGLYFLYKRFFYQRKKIQKYLDQCIPKLTRKNEVNVQQWKEWFQKGQRQSMLKKCKQDNINIENSLKRMAKKMQAKQLPGKILLCVPYTKNMKESTKIAVQHVVDQYDQAVQQGLQNDPEIFIHLCQMINSLYVLGQIDGKLIEKKPINEISNIKRTKQQLNKLVQFIYDRYQQQ